MQKVHFIGICNEAMHHVAIAVSKKNSFSVTGSDACIEEPFYSRLKAHGILPHKNGWFPSNIQRSISAVVVAHYINDDNPELLAAKEMGLKIYSYPEFIYQQTRSKTRIVIAGSQGKSSIAHIIIHVLNKLKIDVDYITCGQDGCENKAKLTYEAKMIVIEGQDFSIGKANSHAEFSSYKPHVAIITGINHTDTKHYASNKDYIQAYANFVESMEVQGRLIHVSGDESLNEIIKNLRRDIVSFAYNTPRHEIRNGITYLNVRNIEYALPFFGDHQLKNLAAAQLACKQIGVYDQKFFEAFADYKTQKKRLELLSNNDGSIYVDAANTPTKIKATLKALRKQFPDKKLVACYKFENKFLTEDVLIKYADTFSACAEAFIHFQPLNETENDSNSFSTIDIKKAFQNEVHVFESTDELKTELNKHFSANTIVVYMPEVF